MFDLCTRDHDCAQGEDEQNCTHTCGPKQFQCKQQKQCIDRYFIISLYLSVHYWDLVVLDCFTSGSLYVNKEVLPAGP